MDAKPLSISVFFPCYHDWGTIASMVLLANATLKKITPDYEIIVVNDGSRDHSEVVLRELEEVCPKFRAIHHEQNRGYGGALRSGFAAARNEWIFYTDGDAQYDVREITKLIGAVDEMVDVVNGYKISRSDPVHRAIIGRLYHWTVKVAFGLKIRDVDCDFRLIRKKVFDRIELKRSSGVICLEMMKKIQDAGFRIVEVPVHHYHRLHGKSQFFNFRRVFQVLRNVLELWVELVFIPAVIARRAKPDEAISKEKANTMEIATGPAGPRDDNE